MVGVAILMLMEEGKVIEQGTHEELMGSRGVYYEMVRRQMESHGEVGEEMLR